MSQGTTENNGRAGEEQFGFTPVGEGERQGLVNRVFARVASRYDLMNDLMSGGLHRLWKDDLINWLAPPKAANTFRLLDVAGGTGDISSRFLKAAGPGASCTLCDISAEMLGVAKNRFAGIDEDRLQIILGDAVALPLPDDCFDAYTIAFGIRNVTDIDRALGEAWRVLKPGGRFLCLEFSHVDVPFLDTAYKQYSTLAIPRLGGIVAGDAASYQYLVESIAKFPDQESFAALIGEAGFEQVRYRNLTGGIAALHSGWKI
ncbi:MAG TPA: bifunctional demethylmenaquinone methyltransferase/2-methoxy-6-polyprenyl-1,4-benzoquinol methylase UbiE [Rhizobiales bacterium]|nr:ubiquinone/menaquinone biosynthesis C-methyltransferase UbiE [bacterium BMS3Bbin10]HDO52074.1 bifunctional demethylmenaquinone methyltransferase/2-methoxy-6-polyprenyl-1,4-benzoquinol methylase UbiE [Hyphomicrobiales bacterium]